MLLCFIVLGSLLMIFSIFKIATLEIPEKGEFENEISKRRES